MRNNTSRYAVTCTVLILLHVVDCQTAISQERVRNPEEYQLIRDPHFQCGFVLLAAEPGKRVPYGTFTGMADGKKPVWELAQWSSKQPFTHGPAERTSDTAIRYANAAKSITVGKPGSSDADISMAVNGTVEYDKRARKRDEPWVHLLLQQDIEDAPVLTEIQSARFRIEARLHSCTKLETPDYSPGLHAAQFQVFFSVQNRNRDSAGYGEYLWFGIPLYDDRHEFPKAHKSKDVAGTNMFIFTPAGETYTSKSAHGKEWITVDKDLLPLMREGLELACQRGFLKHSQSLADYRISGMNIGWEVPGVFDVALQVRNLSLKVRRQQDVSRSPS